MTKLVLPAWLVPAGLLATALLAACSPQPDLTTQTQETSPTASAVAAAAATPPVDDGLSAPMDSFVADRKGHYELWENFGDDSGMCDIQLTDVRTIGGYAIDAEPACLEKIKVPDLFAWFIASDDGYLVFIDATRQPLMRLLPDSNGVYFGNSDYYAIHQKQ